MAAGDGDPFADFAVEHAGLVPDGGNGAEERQFGLVLVSFRVIGDHLEGALENDEQGDLVGARAHHQGLAVARLELGARDVAEAAGGVIHGTGEHASVGEDHVVGGSDAAAPLQYSRPITPSRVIRLGQVRRVPSGLYAP